MLEKGKTSFMAMFFLFGWEQSINLGDCPNILFVELLNNLTIELV